MQANRAVYSSLAGSSGAQEWAAVCINHYDYECPALESFQDIEDEFTDVAAKSVDNRVMHICAMRYLKFLYALQKSKTPSNNTASCWNFAHEMPPCT